MNQYYVFDISRVGVFKNIGQIESEVSLEEMIKKARKKYNLEAIMLSEEKEIKVKDRKKKVNPFEDTWIPGATWIDGLRTYNSPHTGFVQAKG